METGDWQVIDRRDSATEGGEDLTKDWWIRKGGTTWHWTDMTSATSDNLKGAVSMIFLIAPVVDRFQWVERYLAETSHSQHVPSKQIRKEAIEVLLQIRFQNTFQFGIIYYNARFTFALLWTSPFRSWHQGPTVHKIKHFVPLCYCCATNNIWSSFNQNDLI